MIKKKGPIGYLDIYTQIGLVSFGAVYCGTAGLPGVYTNVAYFMEWILENLDY